MLEYAKTILPKVCSWKYLFRKELKKCYNWIPENQLPELYKWSYKNFHQLYPDVLEEVFKDLPPKLIIEPNTYLTKRKTEREYDFFANSA